MPPPRALKKGDRIYCLLENKSHFDYEIVFRGRTGQSEAYLLEVGVDWLSDPDTHDIDELLLVEVKVLKRLLGQKQKAKVKIE